MTNISEQIIADLLLEQTGQELTDSRRWRIGSALSGLFRERGLDNLEQLVVLLSEQRNDVLAKETVDALLNNETYFFRDKPLFEQLENEVLPRIAKQNENRKRISIWSAGCSTGQEALTLAMMFANQTMRWKILPVRDPARARGRADARSFRGNFARMAARPGDP
jgi:chemotaxis protein methyltransferase CheR